MQYGSQLIVNPENRDPGYDFVSLFSSVIWGNTQIFLPLSLVMTGGWMIDREHTNDTMKNLLTVPVSYPGLLGGRADRHHLSVPDVWSLQRGRHGSDRHDCRPGRSFRRRPVTAGRAQVVAAAFNTCLVCMPMILIFGQIRGAYLGGSLLTFFLGYCILFFKSGFLLSAYPFSAALILAGFDMQDYNGATQPPSILLSLAGIAAVLVLTAAVLLLSHPTSRAGKTKKKKGRKGRGRQRA